MHAIIVCVSGITSSILSKRLNNYSESNGYDINFSSIGYRDIEDYIVNADIVLITPQVKIFEQTIIDTCNKINVPFTHLENNSMYDVIEKEIVNIVKSNALLKSGKNNEHQKISFKKWLLIYWEALINIKSILFLSISAIILRQFISGFPIILVHDMTANIFAIYFSLSLGYVFAKEFQYRGYRTAIFSMACLFLSVVEIDHGNHFTTMELQNDYIIISNMSLLQVPLAICIVTFSLTFFHVLSRSTIFEIPNGIFPEGVVNFLAGIFQEGSVFVILLTIRYMVSICQ